MIACKELNDVQYLVWIKFVAEKGIQIGVCKSFISLKQKWTSFLLNFVTLFPYILFPDNANLEPVPQSFRQWQYTDNYWKTESVYMQKFQRLINGTLSSGEFSKSLAKKMEDVGAHSASSFVGQLVYYSVLASQVVQMCKLP